MLLGVGESILNGSGPQLCQFTFFAIGTMTEEAILSLPPGSTALRLLTSVYKNLLVSVQETSESVVSHYSHQLTIDSQTQFEKRTDRHRGEHNQ